MFPCAALTDEPDIRRLRVELTRDFGIRRAAIAHQPDLNHVAIGQLGEMRPRSTMRRFPVSSQPRVRLIFLGRHILKVIDDIIARIVVDVVDLISGRTFANKGSGNKSMHLPQSFRCSAKAQRHSAISACVHRRQNFARNASDASQIAHLVVGFKAFDGSPLLIHRCSLLQNKG